MKIAFALGMILSFIIYSWKSWRYIHQLNKFTDEIRRTSSIEQLEDVNVRFDKAHEEDKKNNKWLIFALFFGGLYVGSSLLQGFGQAGG